MVAVVAVLAACQTTNAKLDDISPQGSILTGEYLTANGRVKVPLPEGEWIVAGSGYRRVGYENPIEEVILVQVDDGTVIHYIEIRTDIAASPIGWKKSTFCERNDIHYIKKISNVPAGSQDCWGINHFRMTFTGKIPLYMEEARTYIVDHKIRSPLNALAVEYRLADKPHFLDVKYFFNPEADGFEPPKIAEWATSDWHRDRVYMDPKKVAYIKKLKSWGEDWHTKVKAGFEGKQ
jgi:hypothetical protein|tara:strand:+ start:928 stop:1632 length:705 start_codon:yes stop_codon:yes gene_type:complete